MLAVAKAPDSDRSNPRWAQTCSNSAKLSDSTWARVGIQGNQVGGVTGVDRPLAKNNSDEDTGDAGDDMERVVVAVELLVGSATENVAEEDEDDDEVAAFDQEEEK